MNVFDLGASLKLDSSEYDKGLDNAEHKGEGFAKKLAGGLGNAAKAAGVAIGAAATAVGALTAASVKGYAEYEQLVGGVETLFGAQGMTLKEYGKQTKHLGKTAGEVQKEYESLISAQDTVMKNASEAYKTAGLSANEYMETVTSFAAALNSSLGGNTEKSAKVADQAIRDMSDNANKMGTAMESIQTAYQGFAKQNYTMLDNLKLGYGGTKEEMARLLADAEKISGQKFDLSNYADIVEAIHVVQTEMGITGTTAKEAEKTISGSLAMTKSAWENLVTGFTNPDADLGALINNVVDSASKAFENLMPAITQAMEGIGSFVEQIAPVISEKIPALVDAVLPPLLSAATSLVSGLVSALPGIATALVEQIPTVVSSLITAILETGPQFIDAAHQMFDMLVVGINEAIPTILALAPAVIMNFINGFTEALPIVTEAAVSIMNTLSQGISTNLPILVSVAINAITEFINTLVANAGLLLDAGINLIASLAKGIVNSIPTIKKSVGTLLTDVLNTITKNLPKFLDEGVKLITNLANGLLNALPQVLNGIGQIISKLLEFILSNAPVMAEKGLELIMNLAQGLLKALPNIIQSAVTIITGLINQIISHIPQIIETGFKLIAQLAIGLLKALPDILKAALSLVKGVIDTFTQTNWLDLGINIVKGVISGLSSMGKAFLDAIVNLAKSAFNGIKNFFGIHSPSKKMRDEIGKNIVKGLIEGVNAEKKNAKKSAEELGALYVSAAKKKVDTLKANNKLSLQEEWAYWLEVREHTKKGSKAYDEATKMIGKAKQNINKAVKSLKKDYKDGVNDIIKDLEKGVKELKDNYVKAVEERKKSITSQLDLFDAFEKKEAIGGKTLTENLKSQIDGLKNWNKELDILYGKINTSAPELYEELSNMGVDQYATLHNIASMSKDELDEYVRLWREKQSLAQKRAETDNLKLKQETDKQIEKLKRNAEDQINALEEAFIESIESLGVECNKSWYMAGTYAIEGMGIGMNTEFDKLEKDMKARAKDLVGSVQDELKIQSPSKVFADEIGKWIPLGIEQGVEKSMPEAERGILDRVSDMKDNVASIFDSNIISIVPHANTDTSIGTGFVQNLTINSPTALLPSEIARQTRLANQQMTLALNGV